MMTPSASKHILLKNVQSDENGKKFWGEVAGWVA
jgi:hypothetical protein